MKKFRILFVLLVLILAGVIIINYPRLNIITGFAAKSVCSCTFEAGRDQESIESGDNDIDPIYYAKNVINYDEKSVTSTVFGLKKRKAIYTEGVGCILLPSKKEEIQFKPNRIKSKSDKPYPYGEGPQKDTVFTTVDYESLKKAVDSAFDHGSVVAKRTRAVVVVHKDQIIAERYADGFDRNTKILAWPSQRKIPHNFRNNRSQ